MTNNFNNIKKNILDLNKQINENKIKVIPLKKNSKIPLNMDYYNKNYTIDDLQNHEGNFGVIVGANHKESSLAIIDIDGYKLNNSEDKEYDSDKTNGHHIH